MIAQQMLGKILCTAKATSTPGGKALETFARVGSELMLAKIALIRIAALAARFGAAKCCRGLFGSSGMLGRNVLREITELVVDAFTVLALVAIASVQRFAAMFGEQSPLVELELALGAGILLAATLMALLLPLLVEAACTLLAAIRIVLRVLGDLVTTQL